MICTHLMMILAVCCLPCWSTFVVSYQPNVWDRHQPGVVVVAILHQSSDQFVDRLQGPSGIVNSTETIYESTTCVVNKRGSHNAQSTHVCSCRQCCSCAKVYVCKSMISQACSFACTLVCMTCSCCDASMRARFMCSGVFSQHRVFYAVSVLLLR